MFRESSNVLLSPYLDDIILIAKDHEYLSGETKRLCKILNNCNFRINETKYILTPSKKIHHLGYEINQNKITIQITEKHLNKILNILDEVYNSKKISYTKLAYLLSNAVSTKFLNENIMLYITLLYNVLSYDINTLNKSYENFVFLVYSNTETITNLRQYLSENRGISIIENQKSKYINIFTDATPEAIGIYIKEFNISQTLNLVPNQKS
uniref:Reverse transcriptase domain-containing protein n=1 Tax=Strongyloides venezuelensis TaxID=75913 RepID=A0A0K0FTB7_STRVS